MRRLPPIRTSSKTGRASLPTNRTSREEIEPCNRRTSVVVVIIVDIIVPLIVKGEEVRVKEKKVLYALKRY